MEWFRKRAANEMFVDEMLWQEALQPQCDSVQHFAWTKNKYNMFDFADLILKEVDAVC